MFIKSKYNKHSIEEKLKAVELYSQGYGCRLISEKLSIDTGLIGRWLRLYRCKGLEGFIKTSRPPLSNTFRQIAVQDYLENKFSHKQVVLKD